MKSPLKVVFYTLFLFLAGTFFFPKKPDRQEQKLVNASPANVEFAWDIHGVLLCKNTQSIQEKFKYKEFFALLPPAAFGALASLFDNGLTTQEHRLLKHAFALIKSKNISGEGFYWLFKKYGFPTLANTIYTMSQEYTPRKEVLEIIKELDQLGYTQRIASNIGSEFYKVLQKDHPELFSYFKGGKTVEYVRNDNSINFNPIRKPNPEYKAEYLHDNPDHKKNIIFIDDFSSNTEGLKGPHWITLQFTSAKALRKDLKKLGIPLQPHYHSISIPI